MSYIIEKEEEIRCENRIIGTEVGDRHSS